jgi:hypothetical protein
MEGDYQVMKALHQFMEGTRTASVYLLQGKDKFLVLYYDSQDDYNEAGYFILNKMPKMRQRIG